MRHTATLIAGIVIAPLAWILIAFGQDRSAQAFANAASDGGFHTGDFVRPLLFLATAGILLGLIATLRVSPLGTVVTGALYAASYALLFVTPKRLVNLIPNDLSVAGRHADLTTPLRTGTTLLLGAAMLVAAASAGRWRRWPARADATASSSTVDPLPPLDDKPMSPTGLGADGRDRDTVTDPDSFDGFGTARFDESRYGDSTTRYGDLTRPATVLEADASWVDSLRPERDGDRTKA
ncbi:hypothetical protein GCM10023322_10970 [Rugosimonospora acidiphila]|uniref:Tryptophan-associated transmembrane protein (Trp_oprn_chp) n=1 Tax=Rugosimonospora acidiphila TaxID=556531 RepID=A0ABP9RL36_9ACTN